MIEHAEHIATPMVRNTDPQTSRDAADRLQRTGILSETQALVLEAITEAGARGLTDYELAALPQFAKYRESTARKRRCELATANRVFPAGIRDRQTIWVAASAKAQQAG